MKNNIKEKISPEFYDVPENVSHIEAIIFDWVAENYGETEAESGSWCIPELAAHIEAKITEMLETGKEYQQKFTVCYDKIGD